MKRKKTEEVAGLDEEILDQGCSEEANARHGG